LSDFLADVTLHANDEKESEAASDKVTLMTLHSAKGLEFGEVYLVGMEEGLLPHAKAIQDGAVEEERRLAYVGITRARRRLTMTYTVGRAKYGERVASTPSRFLYESLGKQPPSAPAAPPSAPAPAKPGLRSARRTRR
jgi:superfamily I DNA/RNA helicase